MKKSLDWTIMEEFVGRLTDLWENENWQKVNHHDHTTAKKKDVAETTGDPKFDKMLKGITGKKAVAKQQKADTKQQARDAFGSMFGGGNPADKLKIKEQGVAEDWNKVNHHDKTNGLSQKAVNAYRHEHPGSKLKTAVTTKPSKLKAGSKDAKRRKSFCARMSGNEGPMKKPNGEPTPKALALRRWNCE